MINLEAINHEFPGGTFLIDKKTDQLIKSEKAGAWKKMARQIAHEIKNPLTPVSYTHLTLPTKA